jgi:hypothetical protein
VRALRILPGVVLENFDERLRVFGNADHASGRREIDDGRRKTLASGTVNEAQQVLRRCGLGERGVGQ